jgi:hypothetical protein
MDELYPSHASERLMKGPESSTTKFPDGSPAPPAIRERYTIRYLLFDIFCLAWIAPISFALYVNFQDWVVGAGVGCRAVHPSENCFPDLLGTLPGGRYERLAALNRQDREILGALQVISKMLDMWFTAIAPV